MIKFALPNNILGACILEFGDDANEESEVTILRSPIIGWSIDVNAEDPDDDDLYPHPISVESVCGSSWDGDWCIELPPDYDYRYVFPEDTRCKTIEQAIETAKEKKNKSRTK